MPPRLTVHIFRRGDRYFARFSDPAALGRLGSDTITTPHPIDADPLEVLRYVQEHFPEADVALVRSDAPAHPTARTAFHSVRSMN